MRVEDVSSQLEVAGAPVCLVTHNLTFGGYNPALAYPSSVARSNESVFNLLVGSLWSLNDTASASSTTTKHRYVLPTIDAHLDGIPNTTDTGLVYACKRTGITWVQSPSEVPLDGNRNALEYITYALSYPRVSSTSIPLEGSPSAAVPNVDLFVDPLVSEGPVVTDAPSAAAAELASTDLATARLYSASVEAPRRAALSQGGSTSRSRFVTRTVGLGWDTLKGGALLDQQRYMMMYTPQGRALLSALSAANNLTGLVVNGAALPTHSPYFQSILLKALMGYTVDPSTGSEVAPTSASKQALGMPVRVFADGWLDLRFLDDTWWMGGGAANLSASPLCTANYSSLAGYILRGAARGAGTQAVTALFSACVETTSVTHNGSLAFVAAVDPRYDIRERRRLVQEKLWKLGRRAGAIEGAFRGLPASPMSNDTIVIVGELVAPSDSYLEEAQLYRSKPYLFDHFDTTEGMASYIAQVNGTITSDEGRVLLRSGSPPSSALTGGSKLTAMSTSDTTVGVGGFTRSTGTPRTASMLSSGQLFTVTYKELQDAIMKPLDSLFHLQLQEEAAMRELLEEAFPSSSAAPFSATEYEVNFLERLRARQQSLLRDLLYHPLCGLGPQDASLSAQGGSAGLLSSVRPLATCNDSEVGCGRSLRRDRCFHIASFSILPSQLQSVLRGQAAIPIPTAAFVSSMVSGSADFWSGYTRNVSAGRPVLDGLPSSSLHLGGLGQVSLRVSVRSSVLSALGDLNSRRYASGAEVGAAAALRALQRARDNQSPVKDSPIGAASDYVSRCVGGGQVVPAVVLSRLSPPASVLRSHLHLVVGGPPVGLLGANMEGGAGGPLQPVPFDTTSNTMNGSLCTPSTPGLLSACTCAGSPQPSLSTAAPLTDVRYATAANSPQSNCPCRAPNSSTPSYVLVERDRMVRPAMLMPLSPLLMDEVALRRNVLLSVLDARPHLNATFPFPGLPANTTALLSTDTLVADAVLGGWLDTSVGGPTSWWARQGGPNFATASGLRAHLLAGTTGDVVDRLQVQFGPPVMAADTTRWRRLRDVMSGHGFGIANMAATRALYLQSDLDAVTTAPPADQQAALERLYQRIVQNGGMWTADVLGTPYLSASFPAAAVPPSSVLAEGEEERLVFANVDVPSTFGDKLLHDVMPSLVGGRLSAMRGFAGARCAFDQAAALFQASAVFQAQTIYQSSASNITVLHDAGVVAEFLVCRVPIPPTASSLAIRRSGSLNPSNLQISLRRYGDDASLQRSLPLTCILSADSSNSCREMTPCDTAPTPVSNFTTLEVRIPVDTLLDVGERDVIEFDGGAFVDPLLVGGAPNVDGSSNSASRVCTASSFVDVFFTEGSETSGSTAAACNKSILNRFGGNITFLQRFGELTVAARKGLLNAVFNSRPHTGDDAVPFWVSELNLDPIDVSTLAFPRTFSDTLSPLTSTFDTRSELERTRYMPTLSAYQQAQLEGWAAGVGISSWGSTAPNVGEGCLSFLELCDGFPDMSDGADEAPALCGGPIPDPMGQARRLASGAAEQPSVTDGASTVDTAIVEVLFGVNVSESYTAAVDASGNAVGGYMGGPSTNDRDPLLGSLLLDNSTRHQCIPQVPPAFQLYFAVPRSACLKYVRGHNIPLSFFTISEVASSKRAEDDLGSCVVVPSPCLALLFGGAALAITNATNLADVFGGLLGHNTMVDGTPIERAYWGLHYPTAFVSRADAASLSAAVGTSSEASVRASVFAAASALAKTAVTVVFASPATIYRPFNSSSVPTWVAPTCSASLFCNSRGYAVSVALSDTSQRGCRCVCDRPWSGAHCGLNLHTDEASVSVLVVQGRYRPVPLGSLSSRTSSSAAPGTNAALNVTHLRVLRAMCSDATWELHHSGGGGGGIQVSSLVSELLGHSNQHVPLPACTEVLSNLSTALFQAGVGVRMPPLDDVCSARPLLTRSNHYGGSYTNGVPITKVSFFDEVRLHAPTQSSLLLTRATLGDLYWGSWLPSSNDGVYAVKVAMTGQSIAHAKAVDCLQQLGQSLLQQAVAEAHTETVPDTPSPPLFEGTSAVGGVGMHLSVHTYPRHFDDEVLLNPKLTPLLTPLGGVGFGLSANPISRAARGENLTIWTSFQWAVPAITSSDVDALLSGAPNAGRNLRIGLVPVSTIPTVRTTKIETYTEQINVPSNVSDFTPPVSCTVSEAAFVNSTTQGYPLVTCLWDGIDSSSPFVAIVWSYDDNMDSSSAVRFVPTSASGPSLSVRVAAHPLSEARTLEVSARLDNSIDEATGRSRPYYYQDSQVSTRIFLIALVTAFTSGLATCFFAIGARLKDGSTKLEAQAEASHAKHTLLQARKDDPLASKVYRSRRTMLGWSMRIFSMTQRYGGVHWLLRYDRCFVASSAISFLCFLMCVLCTLGLVFGEQFTDADYWMVVEMYPNDNCHANGISQGGVQSYMAGAMAHSAGWCDDAPLRTVLLPADGSCQSTTVLDRFSSLTVAMETMSVGIATCGINYNTVGLGSPSRVGVKQCSGLDVGVVGPYTIGGSVGNLRVWNQSAVAPGSGGSLPYFTKSYCIRKGDASSIIQSRTQQGTGGTTAIATLSELLQMRTYGAQSNRRSAYADSLVAALPRIDMSPVAAAQLRSSLSPFSPALTQAGAQRNPVALAMALPSPGPAYSAPLPAGVPSTYYQYAYNHRSDNASAQLSTSVSAARLVSNVAALGSPVGPSVFHTVATTSLSATYFTKSYPSISAQGDAPVGAHFDDPISAPSSFPARLSSNAQGSPFDIGALSPEAFSIMFWMRASHNTRGVVLGVSDDWRVPTESAGGADLPLLRAIGGMVQGRGTDESSWPYPQLSVYYAVHVDGEANTISFVSVRGLDSPSARSYRDYVIAGTGVGSYPTTDFNMMLTWNVSTIPSSATSVNAASDGDPSLFDGQWHQVALTVSYDESKVVQTSHLEMSLMVDGTTQSNHNWDKCLDRRIDSITSAARYPLTSLPTEWGGTLNSQGVVVVGAVTSADLYAVEVFGSTLTSKQVSAQGTSVMQQDSGFTTIYFAALGIYVLFAAAAMLAITVIGVIQEATGGSSEQKKATREEAISSYQRLFESADVNEGEEDDDLSMSKKVTTVELRRPTCAIRAPEGMAGSEDSHLRGNNIDPYALYYVPNWKHTVRIIGLSQSLFTTMLTEIHKVTDSLSAARAQVMAIMWKQGVAANLYEPTSNRFKGLLELYKPLLITDLVTDAGECLIVPPDVWNDFVRRVDPAVDKVMREAEEAPSLRGRPFGGGPFTINNKIHVATNANRPGRAHTVRFNTATTTTASSTASLGGGGSSSSSMGSVGTKIIEALRPVVTALQALNLYTLTFSFPVSFTAVWSALLAVFSFDLLSYLSLNVPDIVLPSLQLAWGILLVVLVAYFTYTDHASWALIVAKYVQRRDQVDADRVFMESVRRYNPLALATVMKAIRSGPAPQQPTSPTSPTKGKFPPLPVVVPNVTGAGTATYYVRQTKGLRRTAKELIRLHDEAQRNARLASLGISGGGETSFLWGSQTNGSFHDDGGDGAQSHTGTENDAVMEEARRAIRARTHRWMYPLLRYVLPAKISMSIDQYFDEHRRSRLLELGPGDLAPAVGDSSGVAWCVDREQPNPAFISVSVAKQGDEVDKLRESLITVVEKQDDGGDSQHEVPNLKRRASVAASELSIASYTNLNEKSAVIKGVLLQLQRDIDCPFGFHADDAAKGAALLRYVNHGIEGTLETCGSAIPGAGEQQSESNSESRLMPPSDPTMHANKDALDGTSPSGSALSRFTRYLSRSLHLQRVGIRCPLHNTILFSREQTTCSVDPYDCFVVHHNQRCLNHVGPTYACPSEILPGVRCPYALCEQHFKSNIVQFAMAQVGSGLAYIRSLGVIGVVSSLCFIVAPIFYFPVMRLCLLFLTCDPSFRCLFPHCWDDPDGTFIVAAVVVLLVSALVGLGIPLLMWVELRRRQRVLTPIFHKKAYFQAYNAAGSDSSSEEDDVDEGDLSLSPPRPATQPFESPQGEVLTEDAGNALLGDSQIADPPPPTRHMRQRSKSLVASQLSLGDFVEDIMASPSGGGLQPRLNRRGAVRSGLLKKHKSFARRPRQAIPPPSRGVPTDSTVETQPQSSTVAEQLAGGNDATVANVMDVDAPRDFLSRMARLILGKEVDYRLEPEVQLPGERRRKPLGEDEDATQTKKKRKKRNSRCESSNDERDAFITTRREAGGGAAFTNGDAGDVEMTALNANPRDSSEKVSTDSDFHFLPPHQLGNRLDTVDFNEWQRFLNEDGSPMFQLYRYLEFEYMTLPPFLLLYKLLVLLPVVFLEDGSLSQLAATSGIEIAFGVFITWTEPYMSGWVDILYRAGSAHNITLLGLGAIHRVLADDGSGGDTVELLMLLTTGVYLGFVVLVLFLSALWPLITFGFTQLMVERELNKVGMRISDLASLLLNPFMHYSNYVLPYQVFGLMRQDDIDHLQGPLNEHKKAQAVNAERRKIADMVAMNGADSESDKHPDEHHHPLRELPQGVKRGRLFGRRHMAKHTSSTTTLSTPLFDLDDPTGSNADKKKPNRNNADVDSDDAASATDGDGVRPRRSALALAAAAGLMPRWKGKGLAPLCGITPSQLAAYEGEQVDARRKVLREIIRRQLLADPYLYGKNFTDAVRGKGADKPQPEKKSAPPQASQ